MTRIIPATLIAFLAFFSTPGASAQSATRALRITTASNVRVRNAPDINTDELARLPVGTIVEASERSPDKAKVGDMEDFWYLVSAPGGAKGWLFGGLTAPFDAARRDEIYVKLADDRLANEKASFSEMADLFTFLDHAKQEVKRRDALASLQLARLRALQRSLAAIPFEALEKPPYSEWTKAHAAEIVYSEPAGQWFVRADALWELQQQYHDLAIAERIAWEAAQTPLPGECEGYLPCYMSVETWTNGTYLKLYPRGAHADEALGKIRRIF